jgi:hypothetical protein
VVSAEAVIEDFSLIGGRDGAGGVQRREEGGAQPAVEVVNLS